MSVLLLLLRSFPHQTAAAVASSTLFLKFLFNLVPQKQLHMFVTTSTATPGVQPAVNGHPKLVFCFLFFRFYRIISIVFISEKNTMLYF